MDVPQNNTLNKKNITLIDPSAEGGSTAFLVGGSMSGKTSLIVQSLINILKNPNLRDRYDLIIIFSESLSALPLSDLPKRKDLKILIFPMYLPELVKLAKKINYKTDNRYGFYFILDDCMELRGNVVKQQILQLRNMGISTLVSTQYCKNVTPSMRNSFHNIYVTGSRTTADRKILVDLFLNPYLRDMGLKTEVERDNFIREHTKRENNQRELIRIDTTKDEMTTHVIAK